MIQFTLKCDQGHRFESWFQSAAAFDSLSAAGMVCCPVCGTSHVEKTVMAPHVQTSRSKAKRTAESAQALRKPDSPTARAMAALKKKIEANSEYVGKDFAHEAREIHDGVAPARAIHGEASPEEAKKLVKDGIPVTPLPFLPSRKSN